MIRHLDLFSGIGGWALAARWLGGIETIGFCEIDPFPRLVLACHWPGVPIHADIRTLSAADVPGGCDIITASYPCQGFSVAGKRGGEDDDRFLWPDVARLIDGIRPTWVMCENVAGHITLGLDRVLADLENLGYESWAAAIPAVGVNAPHKRERVWIVAYRDTGGELQPTLFRDQFGVRPDDSGAGVTAYGNNGQYAHSGLTIQAGWNAVDHGGRDAPNPAGQRQPGPGQPHEPGDPASAGNGQAAQPVDDEGWAGRTEPRVGLYDDGIPGGLAGLGAFDRFWRSGIDPTIPRRLDPVGREKITGLGNAIVPQVAYELFRAAFGGGKA